MSGASALISVSASGVGVSVDSMGGIVASLIRGHYRGSSEPARVVAPSLFDHDADSAWGTLIDCGLAR